MNRSRTALFLPLLLLVGPALAVAPVSAADETGPETVVVRRGPLGTSVKTPGVLVPLRVETLSCEPERYRGPLEIRVVMEAGPVVAGQALVQFDDAELIRDLEASRRALALAEVKLERTERGARLGLDEAALAMDEAVRNKRLADEALERFVNLERKLRETEAKHRVQGAQDRLQDQREELEQLEKMYKADDLTEETEEIVLQRTRRGLERSLRSFEFQKQRHEWFMTITLPKDLEDLHVRVRKATAALERLKAFQPLDKEKERLELENARVDFRKQKTDYEELQRDRKALQVVAPFAGYAVPGTFKDGKWSGLADTASALEPGSKVKAGQALFTVVGRDGLRVQTSVKEADLGIVKAGLPAEITTALTGKASLEAEVESVARYGSGGKYAVTLRLRKQDERLRAGLTCSASITKATNEEVLYVPSGCLVSEKDEHYVFVVGEDGERRVAVKIGRKEGERVEIVSGLKAGQHVLAKPPETK